MSSRILILGVGNAQVDVIRYCKSLGHEVFALSYRDEGPGRELVDQFDVINIVDKGAVLDHTRKIGADLVYSVGSDIAMPTVGYVSSVLGLPVFVDEATASLLQVKGRLRDFLNSHHLSPVTYMIAEKEEDLRGWDLFPAVVKPVDSQGQRGVFEVRSNRELIDNFDGSLTHSPSGRVIVEQYINGPEISVNAFLKDGKIIHSFITDRYVVENLPGGIVKGHGIPSRANEEIQDETNQIVRDVVAALKIRNGPVYFQLKYDGEKAYIIEVTPRLDGCHLWRLIKLKYGVDLLELSIQLLLDPENVSIDQKSENKPYRRGYLNLNFSLQEPGTPCRHDMRGDDRSLFSEWYYPEGETIGVINGFAEKTGYWIQEVS